MKIYLASSWRNEMQPAIVTLLRTAQFEVYDFRNPPGKSGFAWKGISDNWLNWTPEEYKESLKHPDAVAGFNADFDGMKWADACVLLLPCGRSAHFEAGYFWGAGKTVHILWTGKNEPELMYKGAKSINLSPMELLASLGIKD